MTVFEPSPSNPFWLIERESISYRSQSHSEPLDDVWYGPISLPELFFLDCHISL